jgi:phospholipid/cholesterol/gamma-HCH transport system substrate-binding protein
METRASYVTVGAFVMICLLGLIGTSMWFAEGGGGGPKVFFRTSFEGPVTGLGAGTIVRFNGIEVGNVTELATDPRQPKNVLVNLEINADTVVRKNSVASIEAQGLTGPTYVEISGGSNLEVVAGSKDNEPRLGAPSARAITEANLIPSEKSKVQNFLDDAQQLVETFSKVTENLNLLLSPANQGSISDLLAHLNNASAALDERKDNLASILKNFDTASAKITTTLGKADEAIDSARTVLTSVNRLVGTFDNTVVTVQSTAQKFGQLSEHADKAVSGLDMAQINRLMAEVRVMVSNITRLSTGLEREPSKILYGDNRQGYSPR